MKKNRINFKIKRMIFTIILLHIYWGSILLAQESLLYLKGGDPANWTVTGIPGNQHEEISQWINHGYIVQTMNLTTTIITESLLDDFNVLRLNGELGPRAFSNAEGLVIFNWVLNGGKLLGDIAYSNQVPAVSQFGVQTIEGQNGGPFGLSWYFYGAPMVDGPINGPLSGVQSFASACMDHPVLSPNNSLIVDYYKSGYPMIVHGKFGLGKVVIVFTNAWSHDQDWVTNAYQANIFQEDNLEFLLDCITYFNDSKKILYLKGGDPTNWTVTGVPGNQHEEISQWNNHGYTVQTMNLTTTLITESLLNNFQVLRLNGELGPRAFTDAEGEVIFNWVLNGGKLLGDIAYSNQVPAISQFGVQTIEGQNGGPSGLSWYFYGAPMVDGPINGPLSGIQSFASACMDHPVLSPNNSLIVDYYKSGYPMIVHGEFGLGKVVIVFTNAWSHDQDWVTNAYQANIFQEDNLEFLLDCIDYFDITSGFSGLVPDGINMNVFPNPCISNLNIQLNLATPTSLKISIYNMNGVLLENLTDNVKFSKGVHKLKYPIDDLKPGMYLIVVANSHKNVCHKFIKF